MRIEVAWLCPVCGAIERVDYDLAPGPHADHAPSCNHHGARRGSAEKIMTPFHVKEVLPPPGATIG